MRKISLNRRFHDNQTNDSEVSLSEEESLDTGEMKHYLSEGWSKGRHVITEMNGKNRIGLHLQEKQDGLLRTCDSMVESQCIQTKSNDISVLWHELVSPLTLIKGYTTTMLQMSECITKEQRQAYLSGIDSASNRMFRLLENLRDVNQLEENGFISVQRISLLDLLRQVISEMQDQAKNHVIMFSPHAPLPRVNVDPDKIVQVVNNLLTNAIKYSPDGGDIEVDVRLCRTDLELDELLDNMNLMKIKVPCFIVSVADNGIGIPEVELDHVFNKFYRVKNELTCTVPGVGLGLYICKMTVEAHNGNIWAKNRLSGGSIFSFSLPVG